MTAVHEATLNDLVYPAEIVGKRIRVKLDGSRLIKVHLDKAQQTNVEHKVISKKNVSYFNETCFLLPFFLFLSLFFQGRNIYIDLQKINWKRCQLRIQRSSSLN